MAASQDSALLKCIDAFSMVFVRARHLINDLDRLRRLVPDRVQDGRSDWYWPTTDPSGRQPDDLDSLGQLEARGAKPVERATAATIRAVLSLREAIDDAGAAVESIATVMDGTGQPAQLRWSTIATTDLARMRGAILTGFGKDPLPSCLPKPTAEVAEALSQAFIPLEARQGEAKAMRTKKMREAALAPPDWKHPVTANVLPRVPFNWQRMQFVLELIAGELRRGKDASADRLAELAADGQLIFPEGIDRCLPVGLLDGGGPMTAEAFGRCTKIRTLLGGVARTARGGGQTERRAARAAEADELSDWIEGSLRPIYADKWVEIEPPIMPPAALATPAASANASPAEEVRLLAAAVRGIPDLRNSPGDAGILAGHQIAIAIERGAFNAGTRLGWLGALRHRLTQSTGPYLSGFSEAVFMAAREQGRELSIHVSTPDGEIPRACFDAVAAVLESEADRLASAGQPTHRQPVSSDGEEYRAASWFRKGASAWLRKAAAPGRKTKRVRKRTEDGVVLYCITDVRKWRPDLSGKA
jgi:hypothetical protein